MTRLFAYSDYRLYLKEWYTEKKRMNPSYSYALLAAKAGFGNKGFLHNVISGRKNLSKTSVVKLSRALGHSATEAEFFENLVFFNQASDRLERDHFYHGMAAVQSRNSDAARVQRLRRDQYELYSRWYHSAIRSLIDLYPFHGDYGWLARSLLPPISPRDARRSVRLLERLGLVAMGEDGIWRVTDKHITTGDKVLDLAVLNFHRECTALAARAIDHLPRDQRNITGMTLGMSRQAYKRICQAAAHFRARIVDIVDQDSSPENVYQMNIHIFPMARPNKGGTEEQQCHDG